MASVESIQQNLLRGGWRVMEGVAGKQRGQRRGLNGIC